MSELLVVIVDCTPRSWSTLGSKRQTFSEFLTTLTMFLASFTSMDRRNRLLLLAYNGKEGGYLIMPSTVEGAGGVADHIRPASFRPHLIRQLNRLRSMGEGEGESLESGSGSGSGGMEVDEGMGSSSTLPPLPPLRPALGSLTSCLCLASCYLQAHKASPLAPSTRILVFQASPDRVEQYIAFNNATQCAKHMGVVVDSVVLCPSPSVFLQQAAHQTGGMCLSPTERVHKGLLQYLLQLLLPSASLRKALLLPPHASVNLKAHCLCHKRFVSTAFMCTTCLSLWCTQHTVCPACSGSNTEGSGSGSGSSGSGSSSSSSAVVASSSPPHPVDDSMGEVEVVK